MTNTYATLQDVENLLGRPLTSLEQVRAQQDIDSVFALLEGWCNRKFEKTSIVDERHMIRGFNTGLSPRWAPILTFDGIKYGDPTQPLMTSYNGYWENLTFNPNAVVYISYTTDDTEPRHYQPLIRDLITDVAIKGILQPDQIRYGVVNGYSVEGLSIQYGGSANRYNINDAGPITVGDLNGIRNLRRRVIV